MKAMRNGIKHLQMEQQ